MRHPSFVTHIGILLLGASLPACAPVDPTDTALASETGESTDTTGTTEISGDPSSDVTASRRSPCTSTTT